MADEDDYDDGVYFEDDYLYVEDSYALADELAEASVPSPPSLDLVDDHFLSYDPYDYWMDIEYGTDEYYDIMLRSEPNGNLAISGSKRKLLDGGDSIGPTKRRKIGSETPGKAQDRIWDGPNVVHMPSQELYGLAEPCQAASNPKKYALLPDWKLYVEKNAPLSNGDYQGASSVTNDDDDIEADRIAVTNPRHDSLNEKSPGDNRPDPAQLMSVLQQSLQADAAGGGAVGDLQKMLLQMLSQSEGVDMEQLIENLTKSVLAQVEEGGAGSDMGQWLAQQGVQVDGGAEPGDEDEAEHEDSDAEEQKTKHPGSSSRKPVHRQPESKARRGKAALANGTSENHKVEKSLHAALEKEAHNAGPSSTTRGTKRKAEIDSDAQHSNKHARATEVTAAVQSAESRPVKRATRSSRKT